MDPSRSDQANPQVGSYQELKHILVSGTRVIFLLTILWLAFYVCSILLPGIKPAGNVVYAAKVKNLCSSVHFPETVKNRILIFGDSRILSGFIPELFDSSNEVTLSYNFGLPDTVHFLSVLETIVESGQIPTHVLLTLGWSPNNYDSADFDSPDDRRKLIYSLFPFRLLPRDLVLFLIRSRSRGGIIKYYKYGAECVEGMLAERGYYFIEGQSKYPDHRLPEEFRLKKDKPDQILHRNFDSKSWIFERLRELHVKYDISFYIVPCYYRNGAYAKPLAESSNAKVFRGYRGFRVLGPEYYIYPNKYFSDPAHLNREGAEVYTKELCNLLENYL
jgi:hypothetical protein